MAKHNLRIMSIIEYCNSSISKLRRKTFNRAEKNIMQTEEEKQEVAETRKQEATLLRCILTSWASTRARE